MADDELLTVKEVAATLKLGEETIRVWLREKRIKGIRLGERRAGWRIPRSELDRIRRGES